MLIGWQLVASPILANISSLGSSRKLVLSQAIDALQPVGITDRGGGNVSMSEGYALVVMLGVARPVPRARRLAHAHDGRLTDPIP